tara:strand:- start:2577 stop:3029 length:453 start_codon:yes stop_codon:yes gene_type:complete
MTNLTKAILVSISLLPVPAWCSETPEAFFSRFAEQLKAFNPAFAEKYSNDAKISVYGRKGGATYLITEYNGFEWKTWIRDMMPLVKENEDVTTFSNIQMRNNGEAITVTADRRSSGQCYTDTEYNLVLKPTGDSYEIVEERIAVYQDSHC